MYLPPRWFRRMVVAPVVFVGATVLVVLSPLIHVVTAVLDLVFDRRRWRISRFVGLGLAFCVVEAFALFAMFTTWIGSGLGLWSHRPFWVRAHTVLFGQWLELITRAIRFFLGFDFTCTYEEAPPGPQLVFSRHAGPGDGLLITRIVVREGGRRPRMIGAGKMHWDPFFDIIGERLDFHFTTKNTVDPSAELAAIKAMAAALEPNDVLVIFPEGGNFTRQRRQIQLGGFVERRKHQELERARTLKHTLLPKSGGVSATLDGNPDAVVLFAAHAGLEDIFGLADLWAAVPLQRHVWAQLWPARTTAPHGYKAQTQWLHDEWRHVDDWIEQTLTKTVTPAAAASTQVPTVAATSVSPTPIAEHPQ